MAVRRVNSIQAYTLPQQEGMFPVVRRQPPAGSYTACQVQDWTRGLSACSRGRRSVIMEKAQVLPVISSSGIRWDALLVALALVLLLFFSILFSDLSALSAGGRRVGQLSDGIASLEDSNAFLQSQLDIFLRNPVLDRNTRQAETTDFTITLPTGAITGSLR